MTAAAKALPELQALQQLLSGMGQGVSPLALQQLFSALRVKQVHTPTGLGQSQGRQVVKTGEEKEEELKVV